MPNRNSVYYASPINHNDVHLYNVTPSSSDDNTLPLYDVKPSSPTSISARPQVFLQQELPHVINIERAQQFLFEKRYPLGLLTALSDSLKKIALRFFIIDDSGSKKCLV